MDRPYVTPDDRIGSEHPQCSDPETKSYTLPLCRKPTWGEDRTSPSPLSRVPYSPPAVAGTGVTRRHTYHCAPTGA